MIVYSILSVLKANLILAFEFNAFSLKFTIFGLDLGLHIFQDSQTGLFYAQ